MRKLGTRHENLDRKVYRELKSMIVDRKLKPGDKILQEKISQEFGVSRTPLMCALKKLEQEKLVQAIARRGFYVRRFTKEEVLEAFELREILEGLAARRAAMHHHTGPDRQAPGLLPGRRRLRQRPEHQTLCRGGPALP